MNEALSATPVKLNTKSLHGDAMLASAAPCYQLAFHLFADMSLFF